MAKIHFNNIDDEVSNGSGNYTNQVDFFTLKNDGDEAIVRFMCDTVDDFEILACHDVTIDGKFRKVNCLRNPREPLDNCPLCKRGDKVFQRFFIRMIKYEQSVVDGRTVVTPKACVWERSTAYAKTLKSYIDNYGPLSDVICKIIRHGKAGDMQTTYEIVPNLSKMVFKDEVFVKDPTIFGDWEAFGTIVMDRTFDEVSSFVITGSFPAREAANNNNAAQAPTPRTYDAPVSVVSVPPMNNNYASFNAAEYAAPQTAQATTAPVNAPMNVAEAPVAPAYQAPSAPAPQFGSAPANNGWGAPAGGFVRPTRQY